MYRSILLLIGTALATTATAQVLASDEIPPVPGYTGNAANAAAATTTVAATTFNSVTTTAVTKIGSSMFTTSPAPVSLTSIFTASDYPAGSTLPNGGYICNPAHDYGNGIICDVSAATPTLIYPSTSTTSTTMMSALTSTTSVVPLGTTTMSSMVTGSTNSITWTASYTGPGTTTAATYVGVWTGAADVRAVPVWGALILGAVGLVV